MRDKVIAKIVPADAEKCERNETIMETGVKGCAECVVDDSMTAKTVGSGALNVLATPVMLALMEKAAWSSVQPFLEDGESTVGTSLSVAHEAPTPTGMRIRCESELVSIDGRRLTFHVAAFDEAGVIGRGTHERAVIWSDKFQRKADGKMA